MNRFVLGHAAHPQWRMAAALVIAQLRAQLALGPGAEAKAAPPTLALLYITDHYAREAEDILAHLAAELPEVTDWVGAVGVGIAATGVEYFDEPAMAVMLCGIPADQYRVFSGIAPLAPGFEAHTALVHADGSTPELGELIEEMAARTRTGYLFGGVASGREGYGGSVQFAQGGDGYMRGQGRSSGVFHGGMTGVAFGEGVSVLSRVTQGCLPIRNGAHTITEVERNVIYRLDGEPAMDVLMRELDVTIEDPQPALAAVRATLAGLVRQDANHETEPVVGRSGAFGQDVLVRHIVGLDPRRGGVAVTEFVEEGMKLAFCQRNATAARSDLIRICTEIRAVLEAEEAPLGNAGSPGDGVAFEEAAVEPAASRRIAGAVYVSCSGRGGPHFGAPSAELQLVKHALGDVPLIGFFAGGEIARRHLYAYTGVLTVFLADPS